MFYEVEKIDSFLNCPRCSKRFVMPRILPCGKTLCQCCIDELCDLTRAETNSNAHKAACINCPCCRKSHTVPADEGCFILNEFIVKTLEIKPEKVYRCASFEKFDSLLGKIEKDICEVEVKISNPEAKIREHCEKIRNQIDLNTEIIIEKISNYRDQLFNEVNNYEQVCISNLKPIDRKDRVFKILRENDAQLKNFLAYINHSRIDEDQVKKMMVDAKIQEYQLKNYLKRINNKLFGDSLIVFDDMQKQFDSSIIGRFSYESLSADADVIDIEKIINSKVERSIEYKADKVVPLINDKYIVSHGNLLKIIDENPHTFVEIRFEFEPEYFSHNSNDSVFVMHHRNAWKNASKSKNQFNTFSVYDFNLNLKSEISPEMSILSCFTTNQYIFLQLEKSSCIQVYNWNLEKVTTIGQTIYIDKPYYFRDYKLRMVKNDRMYLGRVSANEAGNFGIRVVSLSTGQVLQEYCLSSSYENFFIDALSRTIVVDSECSTLKIYDKPQSGSSQAEPVELIYESPLDLANTSACHMTPDGRFFFIKDKQSIQYFSFCKAV
jgi:hypothetical protein